MEQGKMAGNAGDFRYVLMLWLLAAAGPALAQDAILTYPQSFFAGAQLATAYDMVGRLPGFVFNDGNGARGYSGTAGNVLVDGGRPTAKTDDLQTILQRIPVSRVDHVEVIRGGAPGIDMQGQPVIANIVLKREDSTTILLTLQNLFYGSGHDVPYGNVEYTLSSSGKVYDITLTRYGNNQDDGPGDGTATFTTPGQPVIVTGSKRKGPDHLGWGINASAALPLSGGSFGANLTLQNNIHNSWLSYDAPEAALYFDGEKSLPLELGTHWDGNWGPAELSLIVLQRLNRQQSVNTSNTSTGVETFTSVHDSGESIARASARYRWSDGLTLESGAEGAYNFLNGHSSDVINGVAQIITGADARVHEARGEAFAQSSWNISDAWSLEAGLHGEYSAIKAEGVPARTFAFPKPRLLASWSPWAGNQFRLRLERVVGQLDFSNFIASSNLAGNGVSAGNARLRPDRRWQIEAAYETHFWDKGALLFSYLHEDITDLLDYVPIGGGMDGPGNIPKAVNDQFDLELAVPLDRAGLEGAIFKSSLKWWDSALRDPVTGRIRSISNVRDRVLNLTYTQDIPAWKSSLELDFMPSGFSQPAYRIAQVSIFRIRSSYFTASWDYKPSPDLDLLFQMSNFIPYRFDQEQDNYAGPRDVSPLSQIVDQRLVTQPRFLLQLRKTF
jgi:hypothetical protein